MSKIMVLVVLVLIATKKLIFNNQTEKDDRNFLILAFILLVMVFGCRNATTQYGTDLNNYYRLFVRAISSDRNSFLSSSPFEMGYTELNWLIARVIKWPQFIVFFQAAVCIGITFRFIYKHSDDVLFSLLCFMALGVMQFYLTGFRQSFSISICLLALEAAEKKKIVSFAIWIAIASLMHQTAIIFIVVYYLVNIKLTRSSIFIDIISSAVLFQMAPMLISLGNDVFDKNYAGTYGGNQFGGVINIVLAAFTIWIVAKNRRFIYEPEYDDGSKLCDFEQQLLLDGKLFHLLVLGTVLYALRFRVLVLERVALYFNTTLIVMLPDSVRYGFTSDSQKLVKTAMFLGLILLIYWRFLGIDFIPFWI